MQLVPVPPARHLRFILLASRWWEKEKSVLKRVVKFSEDIWHQNIRSVSFFLGAPSLGRRRRFHGARAEARVQGSAVCALPGRRGSGFLSPGSSSLKKKKELLSSRLDLEEHMEVNLGRHNFFLLFFRKQWKSGFETMLSPLFDLLGLSGLKLLPRGPDWQDFSAAIKRGRGR